MIERCTICGSFFTFKNGEFICPNCNCIGGTIDDVKMEMILDLSKRVDKLEKEICNSKRKELDWALNQFRYTKKTSDQRKALAIIEKELKE